MTFAQILLVVISLVVISMLLLGINHLFSGAFSSDQEDISKLKEEVKQKPNVISEKNIFHGLVSSKVPVKKQIK